MGQYLITLPNRQIGSWRTSTKGWYVFLICLQFFDKSLNININNKKNYYMPFAYGLTKSNEAPKESISMLYPADYKFFILYIDFWISIAIILY